ncbi:MAG: carboxypeptidase-like regulatory domain-containing protein, partial [Bacteroidota bacterium]|nr:carboxypeptidase-like regulatory domain-containing protein [Bacteroidota bacterium]
MPKRYKLLAKCSFIALFSSLLFCHVFAQKTINGRVINSGDRQPVPGATVQVRNTKIATQTGNDGNFSVRVPADSSSLIITVIGYEQLEMPTVGKTSLGDIAIKSSIATLNDVVVTGYSSQRKKDITGSVAVVNIANAKQVPSGSTESVLQGQAAGVT